jgi:hypothetical protein
MNTTALFAALTIALAGAASLVVLEAPQAEAMPAQQIVKLERVVVEGRRAPQATTVARNIERLPTVVIEGRRDQTQIASAAACKVTAIC